MIKRLRMLILIYYSTLLSVKNIYKNLTIFIICNFCYIHKEKKKE